MNKNRRAMLEEVIEKLSEAKTMLEDIKDEEQEAYENMPESLQGSERGEAMSDNIYKMDDAWESIDTAMNNLQEIVDG